MNARLISKLANLTAFIFVISLSSCKKDDSGLANSNATNAAAMTDSSTVADNAYYDVLNNAFVGVSDNSSVFSAAQLHSGKTVTMSKETLGSGHLGCAIYTIDDSIPGEYPKTLTLDFGSGCTSADGITRSGVLVYLFNNPIYTPGATASVTFTNYMVNGYGIHGQYTITNNSSETNGISYITTVTNGIITYPDASNYHYTHNKTYTMTGGSNTPADISDDVYTLTGTSSLSDGAGNSLLLTATADSPLVLAVSCRNISKGVLSFVYNQNIKGSIDFGDGTCDKSAILYVGNQQTNITLH
jgi:hypothetical protein